MISTIVGIENLGSVVLGNLGGGFSKD